MFEIWKRASTDPLLYTYETLLYDEPNPTLGKSIKWMLSAGIIVGVIIGGIVLLIQMTTSTSSFGILFLGWIINIIIFPLIITTGFIVTTLLEFIAAKRLGGTGNLGSQSYLLAAFQAPITIIIVLVRFVPMVGNILSLVIMLYAVWLNIIALQAAHRYGWGRAIATILLSIAVIGGAVICILEYWWPIVDDTFR